MSPTRREKLANFFIDLAKITFGSLVLGLFLNDNTVVSHRYIMMGLGIGLVCLLLVVGILLSKKDR